MNLLKETFLQSKKYEEYFRYTIKSNLKTNLQGSYLGYLWWLLDPLMFMLVYVFVVSIIYQRGGDNFPVKVFCGTLSWKWSSTALMQSANSIKSKSGVLKQIYLPKFLLPLISVATNAIYYIFGLIVLLPLLLYFKIPLTIHIFEIVVVFFVQFLFLTGTTMILSHIGVFFSDLLNILNFTIRFWFFATPIMYTLEDMPVKLRKVSVLNPMSVIIESYRDVIIYDKSPDYVLLLGWTVASLGLIYVGLKILKKYDRNYTRVI